MPSLNGSKSCLCNNCNYFLHYAESGPPVCFERSTHFKTSILAYLLFIGLEFEWYSIKYGCLLVLKSVVEQFLFKQLMIVSKIACWNTETWIASKEKMLWANMLNVNSHRLLLLVGWISELIFVITFLNKNFFISEYWKWFSRLRRIWR